MKLSALFLALSTLALTTASGCAVEEDEDNDSTESDLQENTVEARAVLRLLNDKTVTAQELVTQAKIASSTAGRIVARRNGADGVVATQDDNPFDTLAELKSERVGAATLAKLVAYARTKGLLGGTNLEVIFSPQAPDSTHTAKIAQLIAGARTSIDIAMYSYSDAGISAALQAATARGVKVRFIFETAGEDKSLTGDALLASKSGQLEQRGVDVRYVNKIMHHKFAIIDGPRDSIGAAESARLVTGSGNWSASAGTKYNENTVFVNGGEAKLALLLQREFNHLWEHSRDLVAKPFTQELSSLAIVDAMIPANEDLGASFTSANFDVNDTTFRTNGKNTVADTLVAAIAGARSSIHIASGHLRSRPVAEALKAKRAQDARIEIKVYLDGQEYISQSGHTAQTNDRTACVAAAGGNESKIRTCNDKGFLFGFDVGSANIDVRYKYYAYRWDNSYAAQMHNKYMIVDGSTLFTGSYNLSDNAEHDTFENMLRFSGSRYAALVASYERSFASIWSTGDGKLPGVLAAVTPGRDFPIVFDPMSLSWNEITNLKSQIRTACPAVDSDEFRQNAPGHKVCIP
jgi:phosphatidylserine/phosphatidylglycerophosphate/cardiolipin synthase-like enzyme